MLLIAENLTFKPHLGPVVLDGVHLVLEPEQLVDIVGPSGAGKTTLLRALARLLPGVRGTLVLAGAAAEHVVPGEWRRHVALSPQRASLRSGSVRDNLTLPWRYKVRAGETVPNDAVLRESLDGVGLDDIELDRDAARLSVGQAARVALLRVTLTTPDVLLLDEPDANLDDASAAQVRAITERFVTGGGACVRVRHLRSDDLAARRLRLDDGRLREVV
ncbi:MAG: ABC transporter ATP-binding protein [Actinobacteria bacterium HGW-Actinobacteria-10]|nr:MAG: ABC transporter ATP-binding protein [Actinobacteria bacterium HGW-Actinobacteria-10]